MKKALIDVAVRVLFFNNPERLGTLLDVLREARPSRLLLYQDGPRSEADIPGIEAARALVLGSIDWDCEVHTHFCTENYGCDPSNYNSVKWAFTIVDKCIFFEDDDIPSLSFFPFCKELLDRYENDQRVAMITGLNYDEVTESTPYDYFFTSNTCINGWATWRRVADQLDDHTYSFLCDEAALSQLAGLVKEHRYKKNFIDICHRHREQGKAFYESLLQAHMILTSSLSIVPKRNLIRNKGADAGGTHVAGTNEMLPKSLRRLFAMPTYTLDFPLRHPKYVAEMPGYKDRAYRIFGINHPWLKVASSIEELFHSLRHGNFAYIGRSAKKRVLKLLRLYNPHH